ncbi:hypothetical protein V6N13_032333 [Hibiscus sabdariffa]
MGMGYFQILFSTSGVSSGMYSSSGILFPQMALARAMDSERPVNYTDISSVMVELSNSGMTIGWVWLAL